MVGKLVRFLVFAVITLGLTLWIAGQIAKVSFAERYELAATFDDVTGLFAGDDVRLAGVKVGQVKRIGVVDGKAEVTFSVDEKVKLPVDSVVSTRWLNLIGQRQLYLAPGSSAELLGDGDTVENTTSVVDLGELVNALGPLARSVDPQKLNDMFLSLVEALDGSDASLDSLVSDLTAVVSTLAERDDTISGLVSDYQAVTGAVATRDRQIATMIDNLVLLSTTLTENSGLVEDALTEFAAFNHDLDLALTDNADELGRILDNLATILDIGVENLDDLEASLRNLPEAAKSLFSTVRYGEFVRVNLICLVLTSDCTNMPATLGPAPPLSPIVQSAARPGAGRLESPASLRNFVVGAS